MASATPWAQWLAHAARVGAGAPEQFWRLSVREWRALTQESAVHFMSRDELFGLAARYPDDPNGRR